MKVSRTNSSKEAIVVSSEKMDSVKQPDQTSHEQSQVRFCFSLPYSPFYSGLIVRLALLASVDLFLIGRLEP